MADKAAFKPNPMFEARVGNGGIRSTDDKVVEMMSPALNADFTPANGRVQIKFLGSVQADGDTTERPLRLKIFASQAAENPVSQFSPAIVNHNKAADHWTFSAVQKLRLPAGLYYFTVERQAEEELIYVGKFTVGSKMQ